MNPLIYGKNQKIKKKIQNKNLVKTKRRKKIDISKIKIKKIKEIEITENRKQKKKKKEIKFVGLYDPQKMI